MAASTQGLYLVLPMWYLLLYECDCRQARTTKQSLKSMDSERLKTQCDNSKSRIRNALSTCFFSIVLPLALFQLDSRQTKGSRCTPQNTAASCRSLCDLHEKDGWMLQYLPCNTSGAQEEKNYKNVDFFLFHPITICLCVMLQNILKHGKKNLSGKFFNDHYWKEEF